MLVIAKFFVEKLWQSKSAISSPLYEGEASA